MGQPDPINEDGEINVKVFGVKPYRPVPTPPSSESEPSDCGVGDKSEHEYVNKCLTNNAKTHHFYNVKFNYEKNADNLFSHYPSIQRSRWQRLIDSFLYKHSRRQYFNSMKHVVRYWSKAMIRYQSVYEQLQFPKASEKLDGSFNHLSGQIWMATFILQQLLGSESTAEQISENELNATSHLFANVIQEGMLTEEYMRNFTPPLSRLTEIGLDLFRKMRHTMLLQQIHPHAVHNKKAKPGFLYDGDYARNFEIGKDDWQLPERFYSLSKEARAPLKVDKTRTYNVSEFAISNLIFKAAPGSMSRAEILKQMEVFLFASISSHSRREWTPLSTISPQQTLNLVNHILVEVADSLTRLREKILKPVLKLLRDGEKGDQAYRTSGGRSTSFLGHVNSMAAFLQSSAVQYMDFMIADDKALVKSIRVCECYLNQIINGGREIMRQVLEVLAMSQMCYTFLSDGTNAEIQSYEEIIASDTNEEPREFLYEVDHFKPRDFFRTQYHEVLRRVPIVVRRVELALHKRTGDELKSEVEARNSAKAN